MQLGEAPARELGRQLGSLRRVQSLTLRDVATKGGVSMQYVQNIERGVRHDVSEDIYLKIGRGMGVDEQVIRDLIFRARIATALENRGIPAKDVEQAWTGLVGILASLGHPVTTDLGPVISAMIRGF